MFRKISASTLIIIIDLLNIVLCRFFIGREKPGEQSEVAQLIQQTLEQERWQREMLEQRYNQYMEEHEVCPFLGGVGVE